MRPNGGTANYGLAILTWDERKLWDRAFGHAWATNGWRDREAADAAWASLINQVELACTPASGERVGELVERAIEFGFHQVQPHRCESIRKALVSAIEGLL